METRKGGRHCGVVLARKGARQMGKAGLISIAAAAMTWACAAQTPPASTPTQASACGMERFTYLVGQPASAIPRDQLPPGARVICAACMVTQDFRADRLNIFLAPDGHVGSLR